MIYFTLNGFSKNNLLVHEFLLFQLSGLFKQKHQEFMYLKLKQINALMACMFIDYFFNATFCIHEPGRLLELHFVANDCVEQEPSLRRNS